MKSVSVTTHDHARRTAAEELVELLHSADVAFELLPHRRTSSAAGEARALAVNPDATGKTVIVRRGDSRVRVVLPASCRLSLRKLAACLDGGVELLGEDELARAYPQFEVGAVPPFGGPHERAIVDRRVADRHSVIVEAGSHGLSLRIAPADLLHVTGGKVADVVAD
jgi:prolyl-tRNA editing enzyme YbaK/EbsC (Cys-tRNA(Pro) deacylase)